MPFSKKTIGHALFLCMLPFALLILPAMAQQARDQPSWPEPPRYGLHPHDVPLPQLSDFERARGCYATREQGYVSGKLMWKPLVVCPYSDGRWR